MQLDELYQEIILDHYKRPRHARSIPDDEALVDEENPTCGDRVKLVAVVKDGRIADIGIDVRGCAICTASASMMAERAVNSEVEDWRRFSGNFLEMMRGAREMADDELGDLVALRGVRAYPVRVKCATMAWHALQKALKKLTA